MMPCERSPEGYIVPAAQSEAEIREDERRKVFARLISRQVDELIYSRGLKGWKAATLYEVVFEHQAH